MVQNANAARLGIAPPTSRMLTTGASPHTGATMTLINIIGLLAIGVNAVLCGFNFVLLLKQQRHLRVIKGLRRQWEAACYKLAIDVVDHEESRHG